MTSNHHAPYVLGYTLAIMAGTVGSGAVPSSETENASLTSACYLQLENMRSKSLVIAGQHTPVNTCPGRVRDARHCTYVSNTRRQ